MYTALGTIKKIAHFIGFIFFGRIKIVYSSRDRRGICRTWIEEIGKDNKYIFSSTSTACLNKDQTKYVLANEFFYDKM